MDAIDRRNGEMTHIIYLTIIAILVFNLWYVINRCIFYYRISISWRNAYKDLEDKYLKD